MFQNYTAYARAAIHVLAARVCVTHLTETFRCITVPAVTRDTGKQWRGGELRVYRRFVVQREVKREEAGGQERPVFVPELQTEFWNTFEAVPYGRGLALILDPGEERLSGQLDSGLWLDVEVREGRPQCVGLRSAPDGPEVTPPSLRFALDKEVSELIERNTVRLELDDEGVIGVPAMSPESPVEQRTAAERVADTRDWYARPKQRRGRRPLSDEHLREVLGVAENAAAQKQPASRAIAERWHVQPATARQWLHKARKARAARAGKEKK